MKQCLMAGKLSGTETKITKTFSNYFVTSYTVMIIQLVISKSSMSSLCHGLHGPGRILLNLF